jgi:hypothetical protein
MPAAERRRRPSRWALALCALVAGAMALRAWGVGHGLPYVYNADENAHFVPRAIGMFGHSLNPEYFINPPAFTYLVHLVYAIRWGGDRAAIGDAFAADPTTAFTLARLCAGALGAAAAGLLAVAGARLVDRRTGLVAGGLLAVAFLPVHYGHLALNDVPAVAAVSLALVGIAGVYRRGRPRDYALAGVALGVGCATKYTAGIVLVPLLAAAAVSQAAGSREARARGLVLAGLAALGGFLVANPYALLDAAAFKGGLAKQSSTAGDSTGKLGLRVESPVLYYLSTLRWGLGWVPSLAALGGAVGLLARDRRLAAVLIPAPLLFLAFMGTQSRFFARWLLPVYPLLCLLAAWAAVRAAAWLAARVRPAWGRSPWPALAAAVVLGAQGLVLAVHNDAVLARPDTRQLARDWLVAHVPPGTRVVVEPVFPDQWAADVGHPSPATPNGNRWIKWPTSRFRGRVVKLEDYERTTRPSLVERYRRGGYCWVVTGSTQYGRAYVEPAQVPQAIRYYDALRRASTVAYRVSPYGQGAAPVPFSFDASFVYSPLAYERPGPEIVIRRLRDCPA